MRQKFHDFKLEHDPMIYRLTFDYNQLADAEILTGLNLQRAIERPASMSAGQMRAVLYAFLKPANEDLDLELTGTLLTRNREAVYGWILTVLDLAPEEPVVPTEFTELKIQRADGTEVIYRLAFDANRLRDAESEFGLNLGYAILRIDLCSVGQLCAILWSMLRTAHPKVSVAAAGELLTADFQAVTAVMVKELSAALRIPEPKTEPQPENDAA